MTISARVLVDRPAWQARAACRGKDPAIWFSTQPADFTRAAAVCATCDVQNECLVYAVEKNIQHGVWGGVSERGRRRVRRNMLAARAQEQRNRL